MLKNGEQSFSESFEIYSTKSHDQRVHLPREIISCVILKLLVITPLARIPQIFVWEENVRASVYRLRMFRL